MYEAQLYPFEDASRQNRTGLSPYVIQKSVDKATAAVTSAGTEHQKEARPPPRITIPPPREVTVSPIQAYTPTARRKSDTPKRLGEGKAARAAPAAPESVVWVGEWKVVELAALSPSSHASDSEPE